MFDKITYIQKNGQKFYISEPKESYDDSEFDSDFDDCMFDD